MNNRKNIEMALKANIPLLLIGDSGWGKSELIAQIVSEMGLPLVDLRASAYLPEDFQGIPKEVDSNYFKYLIPDWAWINKNKEFVLFLDEINQAIIQVLHALYKVVLNRAIGDVSLPKMKIIAAGNRMEENPFLTKLPEPLLKRFLVLDYVKDVTSACEYLNAKYNLALDSIYTNPRQTEMAIQHWLVNHDELAVEKLGGRELLKYLRAGYKKTKGEQLVSEIELIKAKLRNNVLDFNPSDYSDEVLAVLNCK